MIEFVAFDIESHPFCVYDHLTIKDRDGSTLMEKSCGSSGALIIGGKKTNSSLPPRVQSRSNTVYFEFVTDHSVKRAGWRVNWREFSGDFKSLKNFFTPPSKRIEVFSRVDNFNFDVLN